MTATPTQAPPTGTREPPPRRNWLLLGLAAVLLVVVAGVGGWWIGSSGSDDTASGVEEMPEVLEEFYDALLEGDASAMAALFTEDGHFTGPRSSPSSLREFRGEASLWFMYVDYTDVEHLDVIVEDNMVVVVSKVSGMSSTHQRSSKTPFSTTGADVFELRDGQIAQCDMYFDYDDVAT